MVAAFIIWILLNKKKKEEKKKHPVKLIESKNLHISTER